MLVRESYYENAGHGLTGRDGCLQRPLSQSTGSDAKPYAKLECKTLIKGVQCDNHRQLLCH
jgi:hypothetical protein